MINSKVRVSIQGLLVFCLLSVGCAVQEPVPPGPLSLFDGLTVNGWNSIGQAKWFAVDETLVGGGGDGYLVSDESYREFRLTLEFNVDAGTNSGIFVHCQDPFEITPLTCYEINIWDNHPRQEFRTGAIVTLKPPPEARYSWAVEPL